MKFYKKLLYSSAIWFIMFGIIGHWFDYFPKELQMVFAVAFFVSVIASIVGVYGWFFDTHEIVKKS